jgi:hypothetical protein
MEFPSEFPLAKHTRKRIIHLLRMGSLFPIQNAFHLGAYQVAINEAADVDSTGTSSLSSSDAIEKDCYVYRSYIALGSYQVRLKMLSLCFFVSLRDARLSNNIREMMMRKFAHVSSRVRVLAKSGCDGLTTTTLDAHSFARGV